MSANDKEKAELGARALKDFCQQFGDDVCSCELLTILFELLMNSEELALFGVHNEEEKPTESVFDQRIHPKEKDGISDSKGK